MLKYAKNGSDHPLFGKMLLLAPKSFMLNGVQMSSKLIRFLELLGPVLSLFTYKEKQVQKNSQYCCFDSWGGRVSCFPCYFGDQCSWSWMYERTWDFCRDTWRLWLQRWNAGSCWKKSVGIAASLLPNKSKSSAKVVYAPLPEIDPVTAQSVALTKGKRNIKAPTLSL